MIQFRADHVHNHKTLDKPASTARRSDSKETAQYIADMVLELRNLAKAHDFVSLQGLLEVSFYEAFAAANRVEIPHGEIEHLRELSKAAAG